MMSVQKFPFSAFLCCTISWSKFLLPCYRKKKFCSSTTSSRLFLSTRKKMLLFCYHNYRDKFCSCSATSFPTRETPLLPQLQNDLHIYHIFPTRERISSTTTFSWKTWWELLLKLELASPGLQYKTTPYQRFLIMGSFRGTLQRLFRYVCNLGPRLVCLNYHDGKL